MEVVELECDEALLTGESIPVEKTIAALVPKDVESSSKTGHTNNEDDGNTDKPEAPDVPLGDRTNVAFMSSTVSKVCSLVYRPCTRLCPALVGAHLISTSTGTRQGHRGVHGPAYRVGQDR